MRRTLSFLTGIGVGVGAMYLFDPNQGGGRRARLRDRVVDLGYRARDTFRRQGTDLGNRLRGTVAEARRAILPDHPSDTVLAERIRSKIGHRTSHPRAIEVLVNDGRVTLLGPILADEVHDLLRAVGATPGVNEVENQLERHTRSEDHPALQGGSPTHWGDAERLVGGPSARMLAGAAGLAMALVGARALARRRARARDLALTS